MDPGREGELGAQGVGEPAQAEFARAVRGGERRRDPGAKRQIVDQHAGAALDEMRQYGVRAVQIPEQVGAHDLIMGFDRGFDKGAGGSDPGIVDPDVDFPERLDGAPRQLPHRFRVADIGRHGKRPAAFALAIGSSLP